MAAGDLRRRRVVAKREEREEKSEKVYRVLLVLESLSKACGC